LQLPLDLPVPAVSAAELQAPVGALTGEQREAVARRGEPLALSAAAGSGKTAVLVERFIAAVREDGLAPAQILAITFTDRAAGELRERVRAGFLALGERGAARDTEAAFVGTFHGFCARLLRAHPVAAGVDPAFGVLDEGLAGRLRRRAFAVALSELMHGERDTAVALVAAYGPERLRAIVAGAHARLRSRGQRFPRLPVPSGARGDRRGGGEGEGGAQPADAEAIAACALLDELLVSFTSTYERLKQERHALDFDDLELLAGELLEGEERVRLVWSGRFELLMVDEFQDTNRRQLEILRALDRDNLFTVGDEFQAIYGFRFAEVALFRTRAAELSTRGASIALTRNFRSRRALLDTVGAVFEARLSGFARARAERDEPDPRGEPAVELLLTAKSGWEETGESARAIAAGLPVAALWRQAEARLLARRVAELIAAGEAVAGDVVVLLRALGDLAVYERALQQQGLDTLATAGAFWESLPVEDVLAYLRVLANPLDELALYSALASPLVGVSRDGLALLALASSDSGAGVFELATRTTRELALDASDERLLAEFSARLRREREEVRLRGLSELIARALTSSEDGGPSELAGDGPGGRGASALREDPRGLANVRKLARLARRFEAVEGRDLRGFLDHVAELKEQPRGGEADAPVSDGDTDAVRLMSIHAAKGLEFPVVCVADLGRAPYTRLPDLLVDGERIGLQLVRLDGAGATPTLDYEELGDELRREEAQEEDRILYVAMTRARERLLLSGAVDLERRACEGPNGTAFSWLAPALAGDLAELQQAAAEAGPSGLVLSGPDGGGPIRCVLATAAGAAELIPPPSEEQRAPSPDAERRSSAARPGVHPGQLTLVPAGPPPSRAGVGPERIQTLSYSSLSELERCGYRYYLERVLGLGEERPAGHGEGQRAARSLRARAQGTLVHRLLETFHFDGAPAPAPERIAALARELSLNLEEDELRRIADMIDGAARAAPAGRIAAARTVWREHPFTFAAGEGRPLITGVIDVLAQEQDGGYLVVDYKSDPVAASEDLDALVERAYGLQRELYALAALRAGARSVEVLHWFLRRPDEPVSAVFAASDRERLEVALSARLESSLRAGFEVSPTPHRGLCLTCPGRARLCSWPEGETMREHPAVPGAGH
jgi:ATP-dependent exoDNAse (exonuclease V) beta subunit